MYSFAYHLEFCNGFKPDNFTPFLIEGKRLGWVPPAVEKLLLSEMPEDFNSTSKGIVLDRRQDNFDKRSEALARATRIISSYYNVPLRNEKFAVIDQWGDEALAEIDRSAIAWFGVRGFGVHVNGYVRKPDGIYIWVSERALNRQVDPGKFDNLIGGGVPIGLSVDENLRKEAKEEAGFDDDVIQNAKPVGTLRYKLERLLGVRNDTLFIFDLDLSPDIIPHNTDGEVAKFHLMPVAEVAEIIRTSDRFKFNCNIIIIDFLFRHGFFTPEHGEYAVVKGWLGKMRGSI
jgi:8-oxo-dGTP pyrophosphatase MutT (NUDIX family)